MRRRHQINSGEAVSIELFRSALQLADNRGLLDPDGADVAVGRLTFAAELRDLARRVRLLAELEHGPEAPEPALAVAGGA
jgi:glycerol-3-phosphate O-acyltransferase